MSEAENMQVDETIALSNCDREPIHIPGRIQSFGALVGYDRESEKITHFSDNISKLFPELPQPSTDQLFPSYLAEGLFQHAIRGAIGLPTIREQREWIGHQTIGNTAADVGVYETDGTVVVELQPISAAAENSPSNSGVGKLRAMLSGIESGRGVEHLMSSATSILRQVTGYDRVMTYRFLPNDDGEVIAEACGPGIEPYLGLRYPASDIPKQARNIMLQTPSRLIHDTNDPHSLIISSGSKQSLDLSFGHLRGVSPIHVEYLQNMGVRATMNLSLVIDGRLWGLFALHHYRPRHLPSQVLSVAEVFGQLVSMQIQQEVEREAAAQRSSVALAIESISEEMIGIPEALDRHGTQILNAADWDGIALVQENDDALFYGETPSETAVRDICSMSNGLFTSYNNLSSTGLINSAGLGRTAGAIVQKFGKSSWLLFFRNEVQHELRWAGQPSKKLIYGTNGPRLEPRGSFEEYTEQVTGKCREWTRADTTLSQRIGTALMACSFAELGDREEMSLRIRNQQDLLIAELNHRVRNTLALVQSLARQGVTESTSINEYIKSLEKRIGSLANAHNLVGSSGQQWARISDLVDSEIHTFIELCPLVKTDGPCLAVRADLSPVISLLFHELTSNCLRHGALSGIGESLSVVWEQSSLGVTIRWCEKLTLPIAPPEKHGFGLSLIERAVPHECGGKSKICFEGNQLEVELWLPNDAVVLLQPSEDQAHRTLKSDQPMQELPVIGLALVLDDNLVLAMELEKSLLRLGAKNVLATGSISDAQDALLRSQYDVALLDINLGNQTSYSFAERALRLGIAVIFITGYGSDFSMPSNLRNVPRLTKPVGARELQFALSEAFRLRQAGNDKSTGEFRSAD